MPSAIGMMAEKYVMRAPHRYSGTDGPGTLVMVQLASGARRPMPAAARPSILLVRASVAAGAWLPMSVSSRSAQRARTVSDEAVCAWMCASRCTGSARSVPSATAPTTAPDGHRAPAPSPRM